MHLYIHIPFCKQKCSYCDFNSGAYSIEIQDSYIEALLLELLSLKKKNAIPKLKTIYIGGGTPSALTNSNLKKLLAFLKTNFLNDELLEYTIECNPESVDEEFVKTIKEYSINRVSMGVQSTNSNTLKFLNRIHSFEDVINSVTLFKTNGITNFNLDLIYTIPNQTFDELRQSLDDIISFDPSHISCYSLIFEEGTYISNLLEKGLIQEVSDDEFVTQYRFVIDYLKNNGYYQYEISNFSKKNCEAVHNTAYWNNADYIGVGVSAYSKYKNIRYSNIYNIEEYIRCYLREEANVDKKYGDYDFPYTASTDFDSIDILDDIDIFNEYIMLGLRQNKGISLVKIEEFFMNEKLKTYRTNFFEALKNLTNRALIDINGDNISLSQKGRELSNSIYVELMI